MIALALEQNFPKIFHELVKNLNEIYTNRKKLK